MDYWDFHPINLYDRHHRRHCHFDLASLEKKTPVLNIYAYIEHVMTTANQISSFPFLLKF